MNSTAHKEETTVARTRAKQQLAAAYRAEPVVEKANRHVELAAATEEQIYIAEWKNGEEAYNELCQLVSSAISDCYGDLEESLAAYVADGRVSLTSLVSTEVHSAHLNIDPRHRARSLLSTKLSKDKRFCKDRHVIAAHIERAAYNATISCCEESEDSYLRQWDSEIFVSIYSARIGAVAVNIDSSGTVASVCTSIGVSSLGSTWALDQLAAGNYSPEQLGSMTESELCPAASQAERDIVTLRLEQKVKERISRLFKCPRCRERNHTYRQVQIGASDEPATIMCTCKTCGENFEGHN
jgi:DNA-directed RNA polymerase subunit M/transcription elongation factor TFIIS